MKLACAHNRVFISAMGTGYSGGGAARQAINLAVNVIDSDCTPHERRDAVVQLMVASTVHSSAAADNRGPHSVTALHDLFMGTEPSPGDLRRAITVLDDCATEVRATETPPGWRGLSKLERLRDSLDTSLFRAEMREFGFPNGLSETQLAVLEAMEYGRESGTNGTVATLVKATHLAAGIVSTAATALEAGGLIQRWKARHVTSGEGYFSLTDFGKRARAQLAVTGSTLH